ncbi:MAG TPA: peptidoglycan DD-metalloendopeptidase family protein [Alphaproteobacteria bacterium]
MARLASLITALLAVALLVGCTRKGPPAPVEVHGQDRYGRAAASTGYDGSRASETEPGIATVQPGDTLFGIARRHQIPMRAIIDANGLEPPYVLQPGQRLTLPRVRTHVVQAGDTIYGISRRYGVDMSALTRLNGVAPPYTIPIGLTLILPEPIETQDSSSAIASQAPGQATTSVAASAEPIAPASTPAAPVTREVESAPLPPPDGVSAQRQPARAPAAQPETLSASSAPRVTETSRASQVQPSASQPAGRTRASEQQTAAEAQKPPPREQLADARGAVVEPRDGRGFLWPVRGRIVSDFGPKGGGLHNDGINISAPKGTPIRAAESGVVVYAGNELRGFGNLLLLRHADGWVTAYAHADELLVERGDHVKRGQIIARVGMTGNVAAPQLHFEIRRGTRAVNPRDYLVAQMASS